MQTNYFKDGANHKSIVESVKNIRKVKNKLINITVLSENTAPLKGDLIAECGLSFLLEVDDFTILFDTGRNISVCYNAQYLGIDLNKINKIVLSHSHSDHTGGLREVLMRMYKNKSIEVIAHPDIWVTRFKISEGKRAKFKGIPFQKDELESIGANFSLNSRETWIGDKIVVSGEIPMQTDFEGNNENEEGEKRYILKNNEYVEDQVADDQAIFIKSEKGLVIVTGCAHRGIVNTILHARKITGMNKVYAVIGGAHLLNATNERITKTIDFFKEYSIEKIGLCHCTGFKAISLIYNQFPEKFLSIYTGTKLML